ncbi:ricin-type beta-trefoil lectin domain protein [Streptomyces sp. NPDC048479]|uniref:ricin-type beta-trefoil lectin domain protein n=1 Tax=Streptomyces sp. NPDC048479 TaxID=3154725 RepID=UPI0034437B2D
MERQHSDPDYRRRISEVKTNCGTADESHSLAWAHTNTATHTAGGSLSVAGTVKVSLAPLGVGAEASVTTTVGASYSYAWGESSEVRKTDEVKVRPGYKGWLDYGTYHGTSYGVAEVEVKIVDKTKAPDLGSGRYKIFTAIKGDLPKPVNPKLQGQTEGIISQTARMTAAEEHDACVNHVSGSTEPPATVYTNPGPIDTPIFHGSKPDGSSGRISGLHGKCVDVQGGRSEDWTPVQMHECNGTPAQKWTMAEDGTIQSLGKCLDVAWASTEDGARVQLHQCNDSGAQMWEYAGNTFVNTWSNKCLDLPWGVSYDIQLQIYECNGGENQKWNAPRLARSSS